MVDADQVGRRESEGRRSLLARTCLALAVPCVSALIAVVGLASPASAAAATASTPSALMTRALHNAESAGWVHETITASGSGHTFTMDNDIGSSEGRQVIASDGEEAEVIVLDRTAYIYGNDLAVADYFELSTTDPGRFANRWLSLSPTNSDYATVSAAVTLKSDFGNLALPGTLETGRPVTIRGHRVRPIIAHVAASSSGPATTVTLYVTTSGRLMPFEYHASNAEVAETTMWTDWGRAVDLAVPPHPTPLVNS